MQSGQIEILMAAYNGMPYIREQIDSILKQTDTDWHLTVSDDGSTDGTDAVIDDYARRYPDKVERVFAGQKFGEARAHFFWLTRRCKAAYIAYCDDDDVWYADKLEKLRRAMREAESKKEGPTLVFSDQTVTDERMNALAPSLMRYQNQYFGQFDYRSILLQNVVTGGAMMVNRALADLAVRCKDVEQTAMHDWWMAAVAARFGQIAYVDEPLGVYRQHGSNSVGAKDVSSLAYVTRKLGALGEVKKTIQKKKAQAAAFARTYDADLSDADRRFLQTMSKAHSGLTFYWQNRKQIHGLFRRLGFVVLG